MLINILAQLGNRYRNDRIRGLKSLLFPRERNISNEGNRFDYRSKVGKRATCFLPSNGTKKKKRRKREREKGRGGNYWRKNSIHNGG